MADAKGIKVEALKYHTYNGKEYQVGDTYDFFPVNEPSGPSADDQVASLQATGFAARVDRADVAKAQRQTAEKAAKQRATAVAPMTTGDALVPKRAAKSARVAKPKAAKARKG